MRLFSYKMKHNTGFAPNPFHGICTLATCKSDVRLHKRPGDWLAGFTSKALNGDPVGEERLVYLMLVSEKISFDEYYRARRFAAKIPKRRSVHYVDLVGDNIYFLDNGRLTQVRNISHGRTEIEEDVRGEFVLVAREFYYFGAHPLVITPNVRPQVPRAQSRHGSLTHDARRARAFIAYVTSEGPGVHSPPHDWPAGDDSWNPVSGENAGGHVGTSSRPGGTRTRCSTR